MDSNIATRLKLLFEYLDVTSSQFADTCGIARPTLSQILTGRNKKISDVLIGQIHRAYPQVSILWLLFGEGDMMMTTSSSSAPESGREAQETILTERISPEGIESMEIAVNSQETENIPAGAQAVNSYSPISQKKAEIILPPPPARKISHITVYYDDSTFETFYPRK